MTDHNKWEYRVASLGSFWTGPKDDEMQAMLNEWGLDGWEVIAVTKVESSSKMRIVAKRLHPSYSQRKQSWP